MLHLPCSSQRMECGPQFLLFIRCFLILVFLDPAHAVLPAAYPALGLRLCRIPSGPAPSNLSFRAPTLHPHHFFLVLLSTVVRWCRALSHFPAPNRLGTRGRTRCFWGHGHALLVS
ncbi:hypothetical protein B0H19DRAFT_682291 [Mycena capillaripes]|nr:hypothetical protein B0H19DRAFT_682291 [Mycena capillaripes]